MATQRTGKAPSSGGVALLNTRDAEAHWEGPDLAAWEPWSPAQVTEMLQASTPTWAVVGGWAIDLWLGRESRSHGDIEIAAPRCDFVHFRGFFEPRYQLYAAGDGETFALDVDETIPSSKFQCWIADPDSGTWRLDLMLEPGDSQTWVFRRDERIQESRERMIGREGGIPFLKPEGVLLYKAKAARGKDQADLEACLPHLSPDARSWLAASLSLIHPEHHWLEVL
jgi:hypothetical protein